MIILINWPWHCRPKYPAQQSLIWKVRHEPTLGTYHTSRIIIHTYICKCLKKQYIPCNNDDDDDDDDDDDQDDNEDDDDEDDEDDNNNNNNNIII